MEQKKEQEQKLTDKGNIMNWQNRIYDSLVEEKDEPAKVVVTKAEKDRRRAKLRRNRMDRTGKSLIKPKTTMFKGYTVPK